VNPPPPPFQPSPQGGAPKKRMPLWLIALITLPILFFTILPVGATLAIYGVRKYLVNAKTAEARTSLAEIGRAAAATYDPKRGFCPSATHPVPQDAKAMSARMYQSAPSDWDDGRAPPTGFGCLRFSLATPQYYQYAYTAYGPGRTSFTATARGDLNGDGKFSTFTVRGRVGAGGNVEIDPRLEETDPEE
jgi:type IV pilus assembly protein PilA